MLLCLFQQLHQYCIVATVVAGQKVAAVKRRSFNNHHFP